MHLQNTSLTFAVPFCRRQEMSLNVGQGYASPASPPSPGEEPAQPPRPATPPAPEAGAPAGVRPPGRAQQQGDIADAIHELVANDRLYLALEERRQATREREQERLDREQATRERLQATLERLVEETAAQTRAILELAAARRGPLPH